MDDLQPDCNEYKMAYLSRFMSDRAMTAKIPGDFQRRQVAERLWGQRAWAKGAGRFVYVCMPGTAQIASLKRPEISTSIYGEFAPCT